ncbi:MAG: GNAT family N-acetyltransferase [Rickettsiales bacterium]|jgi:RimJ/RimL family protein N-acetyltransferase|nr:GNAT family N-acetyltransferase [Rickettsiales bacterium]
MRLTYYAYPNGAVFFNWCNKKLKGRLTQYNFVLAIQEESGKIKGVVVLTTFPHNLYIDCAGIGMWLTRDILNNIFNFCFKNLSYKRITALTSAKNHRVHKFISRLGFRREAVQKYAWDGEIAMWTFGLVWENWCATKFYKKGRKNAG